ncbi:hypothetical protein HPB49_003803 [Dermacentor silvarum]|uniref:Uncharacterized protein n=1 Tax=Dermacentor silvarum TaxID=543639 RepID=A0ACB8D2L9_DERSI|nr:hypothetical protein HPB49_003803 [Dermacentor silvarum]
MAHLPHLSSFLSSYVGKRAEERREQGSWGLQCNEGVLCERRGALHSVNLCITSWQPEAYVSDLLVKKGLALPTLRHKRIMAQLMEGEPFSTDLQGDDGISNEPPSANGDCDTSARLPAIAEHPSHYPFRADHNLQGDLMPQPAHLILRAHSSQPTDQAKPLYHTQPGDQTIAFNSQTIKHVRALDRGCAHAPAINLAEKMQGIPFAQQVQLTVPQPVTCGTRRPTPQYPEEVPRKFVTLWVHKNRAQEKAALFQQLGIAPPKDWEKLAAKEDARLARTESTAETTMQPTLQAAPHLSGEPADMSFQCFNGTSTVLPCPQSAVQDAAQSGGEPAVQPIAVPALQHSFEPLVQPTLEPAMLGLPMIAPTRLHTLQEPQESRGTSVTPRQPTKNWMREMAAVCQLLGIAPPKDWETLAAKEDARLARIAKPTLASSTMQPWTESTAQTTMRPTLQAGPHSSVEPAALSFQCLKPANSSSTVLPCPQSAVQDPAQSGGEPSVQPIASPAVQRSFEPLVQPTLEPAMLGFSMVSPDHLDALQEPQSSGGTSVKSAAEAPPSREPACEADDE